MEPGKPSRRSVLKAGAVAALAGVTGCLGGKGPAQEAKEDKMADTDSIRGPAFELPEPVTSGEVSIEEVIARRRCGRRFRKKPISVKALSQILWSAQGITEPRKGFRASPSAGALFPMDVFAVLPGGVYRYVPEGHSLARAAEGDERVSLVAAALGQGFIAQAPLDVVITATFERCAVKYGERAPRYCMIEAGCISENLFLQAVGLGLSSVVIGAFRDDKVREVLSLKEDQLPMLIMPIGYPA